jgi:hypothetical protein
MLGVHIFPSVSFGYFQGFESEVMLYIYIYVVAKTRLFVSRGGCMFVCVDQFLSSQLALHGHP